MFGRARLTRTAVGCDAPRGLGCLWKDLGRSTGGRTLGPRHCIGGPHKSFHAAGAPEIAVKRWGLISCCSAQVKRSLNCLNWVASQLEFRLTTLRGCWFGRYRVAPARAVTIQTEAKSCTLEGSPKAARASRNRGSAAARSAGFSRTIFPSGPTFRSTLVIASRSPLDTFSSCDWMTISLNPAASSVRRMCSGSAKLKGRSSTADWNPAAESGR